MEEKKKPKGYVEKKNKKSKHSGRFQISILLLDVKEKQICSLASLSTYFYFHNTLNFKDMFYASFNLPEP